MLVDPPANNNAISYAHWKMVQFFQKLEYTIRAPPPEVPYWDDPRIHNFGNHSILHAAIVPFSVKQIDKYEYPGVDIRKELFARIP